MVLVVPNVLSSDELASLRTTLSNARFVDGRITAGPLAAEQKHVLQLDRSGDGQRELGELVARVLLRHPSVLAAALPKSVRHPSINRYEAGMFYGPHLDAPIMRGQPPLRADISVTVFLSDPTDYEGGELMIASERDPVAIKAKAGDAVLYPSGAVHEVRPVTSGVRLVAVTWMQSMVRDAQQRRLLFNMGQSIAELEKQSADAKALLELRATHDALPPT